MNPLAGARRAGVLQVILGSLLGLGTSFVGIAAWVLPFDEPNGPGGRPIPPEVLAEGRAAVAWGCAAALAVAVTLIALGVFVRGGGKGAVVASIALDALLLAGCLYLLYGVVQKSAHVDSIPELAQLPPDVRARLPMLLGLLIALFCVPAILLVWQVFWLFLSVKGVGQAQVLYQQYQAQYYQSQQRLGSYGQFAAPAALGGPGQPAPPPAPPPTGG